jgi:hypothetical protein
LPPVECCRGTPRQPGGTLATILERRRLTDCRHEGRRRQGANPRELRQPLTRLIRLEYPRDVLVRGGDPLIPGVQLLPQRL